jgi:hypothetical protein
METSRRERHHDLAPAVGEFGKPMKKDDTRPVPAFEARFEQMNAEPVVVVHET